MFFVGLLLLLIITFTVGTTRDASLLLLLLITNCLRFASPAEAVWRLDAWRERKADRVRGVVGEGAPGRHRGGDSPVRAGSGGQGWCRQHGHFKRLELNPRDAAEGEVGEGMVGRS